MDKNIASAKNLLFITWDGEQTNYLESLFFPILEGLQQKSSLKCHVLQFSWAAKEKVEQLAALANSYGISYRHIRINRRIHPLLGTVFSVYKGKKAIKDYIKSHQIDIVMPRSTMPALMLNRVIAQWPGEKFKVIFDADGLPLEERLDFTDLKASDLQYKVLKSAETHMLLHADKVLTRSHKAVNHHLGRMGESHRGKFQVVSNGRRAEQFCYSQEHRNRIREELGLGNADKLWVYTGSLGPQYVVKEMLEIFGRYQEQFPGSRFLVLSGNTDYLLEHLPVQLKDKVIPKAVPFETIPHYLSAADLAFALRQPTWSMRGVAPIKLGEYLLMGLPVIASKGIGDTESMLLGQPFVYLYEHNDQQRREKALAWANELSGIDPDGIRNFGLQHFSLEKSLEEYLKALEGLGII